MPGRDRLLPRRGRGGARGRGRAGARRRSSSPGHFRFQCHGEQVLHLEISLGYQHRGVERALRGRPGNAPRPLRRDARRATRRSATRRPTARRRGAGRRSPSAAGRGAARHRAGAGAPGQPHRRPRARSAGDVGYLPTASYCGRHPRRLPQPHGRALRQPLRPRPGAARRRRLRRRSATARPHARAARRAMRDAARRGRAALGHAVGAGALRGHRACSPRDAAGARPRRPGRARLRPRARRARGLPDRHLPLRQVPIALAAAATSSPAPACAGSRSSARAPSSASSSARCRRADRAAVRPAPRARSPGVSLVEGWRGEICHVALTDAAGRFARYKVVDPSFHNWSGLAWRCATRRSPISRSATRASTSPTAATTSEEQRSMCERSIRARLQPGPPHHRASPTGRAGAARPLPGRSGDRRRAAASTAAAPASRPARPSATRASTGTARSSTSAAASSAPIASRRARRTPYTSDGEYRMAATRERSRRCGDADDPRSPRRSTRTRRLFGRSLRLRQVSAGGCNACEADVNVLDTIVLDLGRFGIQFVASPRHADGLLITGPVTETCSSRCEKTYDAVPEPKIVIAVGACAISGGPYVGHPEVHDGAERTCPGGSLHPGLPAAPADHPRRAAARCSDVSRSRTDGVPDADRRKSRGHSRPTAPPATRRRGDA